MVGLSHSPPPLVNLGQDQLSIEVTRARLTRIFDLLAEDNRLNVFAGEVEVRPQ